ncbi:MAG: hypothetical protein Q8P51_10960, partial [Ignavibacteria bacterium]|nr:hypothetical protein [Ignavibacteria bacterium]
KFKERWAITARDLTLDVLDELASSGALTQNDKSVAKSIIEQLAKDCQEGKAVFVCTKRSFDDEVQNLSLKPNVYDIDAIADWVYLSEALGEQLYRELKGRQYAHNNLTIQNRFSKQGTKYDIYLSVSAPEVMFWSTSASEPTGRWLLSAFGKFGYDDIDLPFWFRGSAIGGVRLRHRDETCRNGRQYDKWSIYLGWEQPMDYSIPEGTMLDQMFKSRKLMSSAAGIYFKTTFSSTLKNDADCEYGIEGSIAMMEKGKGGYYSVAPEQFYTTRNYLSALLKFNRLNGLLDVGGGISWHDLSHVSRISDDYHLRHIEATRNVLMPYLEVGISESGDLLQYALNAQINYNVNMGYGYFVFKSQVMVSNAFGLEFKYFNSLSPFNVPAWQYDNYIVFSPIIRINF